MREDEVRMDEVRKDEVRKDGVRKDEVRKDEVRKGLLIIQKKTNSINSERCHFIIKLVTGF